MKVSRTALRLAGFGGGSKPAFQVSVWGIRLGLEAQNWRPTPANQRPEKGLEQGLRNFSQEDTFAAVSSPDPKGDGPPNPTRYLGLGIQLVATVALFALAGQWLDRRLGTAGWLTILGGLLGFAGTIWSLLRSLRRDQERNH